MRGPFVDRVKRKLISKFFSELVKKTVWLDVVRLNVVRLNVVRLDVVRLDVDVYGLTT